MSLNDTERAHATNKAYNKNAGGATKWEELVAHAVTHGSKGVLMRQAAQQYYCKRYVSVSVRELEDHGVGVGDVAVVAAENGTPFFGQTSFQDPARHALGAEDNQGQDRNRALPACCALPHEG